METQEFLTKLLPTTDNYILWVKAPNNFYNLAYTDVVACANSIAQIDKTDADVYFAIGKHNRGTRRLKETASFFRTLAGDLDVGLEKPYASQREAGSALLTAVREIQLPPPMIVSSGYGLHFYFPLDMDVPAYVWVRMSMLLRAALTRHSVQLDGSKIDDASMVLRPIGTHNKKDPDSWREVRLLTDAAAVNPAALVERLQSYASYVTNTPKAITHAKSAVAAAVLSDTSITRVPLAALGHCLQIAALLSDAGATAEEPLWRASLGIAKFCEEPEAAIQALAGGYPDFDLAENVEKMEHWQGGPTTCEHFERLNPAPCSACQIRGKIKSPTTIAIRNVENLTDTRIDSIQYPRGYTWTGTYLTYTPPGSEDSIPISPYPVYPVAQYTDLERSKTLIRLAIKIPIEGWIEVDLDHTSLTANGKEFNDFIYAKQLWITDNQAKYLRAYIVTYLRELKSRIPTSFLYDHYGWQVDGKFLLGGKLYGGTGAEDIHHTRFAVKLNDALVSKGDLATWAAATQMFDLPELEYHGFVFLLGLAGPLFFSSGIDGLLVNMYSPDSGSGKTITGLFCLSVWGDPEKLFLTVRDTEQALYKTFGTLSSVGAYVDEITTIDAESLQKFTYAITQGRERIRGTAKMQQLAEPAKWKMPIISSSNQDLHGILSVKLAEEANTYRILQLPLHRVSVFDKGGTNLGYKVVRLLKANHGLAGQKFIEGIFAKGGKLWVEDQFHQKLLSVEENYGITFSGPERFIQAAFVLAEMAGELASELGLIQFDYKAKLRQVAAYLKGQRVEIQQNVIRGTAIVSQFLQEHAGDVVIYREFRKAKPVTTFAEPLPKNAVARIEIISNERDLFMGGNIYINRMILKKWCRQNGIEYGHLLNQLTAMNVRWDDSKRHTIYRGVQGMGGIGQTRCLQIDMSSHPDLVESGILGTGYSPPVNITPRLQEVENA